jgi:hypothetical protein
VNPSAPCFKPCTQVSSGWTKVLNNEKKNNGISVKTANESSFMIFEKKKNTSSTRHRKKKGLLGTALN